MSEQQLLGAVMADMTARCTSCGECVRPCAFLQQQGTPAVIAKHGTTPKNLLASYGCSLCGLCDSVCTEGLAPSELFRAMRQTAGSQGFIDLKLYAPWLSYERLGGSALFRRELLPDGCTTVFFPGCALPGTRPDLVIDLLQRLRAIEPITGLVLDCCGKISHDLGLTERFTALFEKLAARLRDRGITRILTACPGCSKVLRNYGYGLEVVSAYELLAADLQSQPATTDNPVVTIHDPCPARFDQQQQLAVRRIVESCGYRVEELPSSGRQTRCCGQGGMVEGCLPGTVSHEAGIIAAEAGGRLVISSCAACVETISTSTTALHVAELLQPPSEPARAPVSSTRRWLNRLRLRFQRLPITDRRAPCKLTGPLALIGLIVLGIVAAWQLQTHGLFDRQLLDGLLRSAGVWAPALYILIYTVAPVAMLPALPLTIVGGILFGPWWGTLYTIIGATLGACAAFLTARYLARDWVRTKLSGTPMLARLDQGIARHGWKIVAITRLVPLFPFNLLNYAFGLTGIGFANYALVSLLCMLPATVAYTLFSSSLPQLLAGHLPPALWVGLGLIGLLALIPFFYRRSRSKLFGITLLALLTATNADAAEIAVARFGDEGLRGWEPKRFKGTTDYRLVEQEGRTVLKAHAKSAASGLTKKLSFNPVQYRYLRWDWKISATVAQGNERTKQGDDYAARVYVIFPGRFFWQMRAINYIWANKLPKGEFVPNAFTANAMLLAAQSGPAMAGQWVSEQHDILADYRRMFGEDPPLAGAVAIMTDTDNTGAEATAWYGDITLSTTH